MLWHFHVQWVHTATNFVILFEVKTADMTKILWPTKAKKSNLPVCNCCDTHHHCCPRPRCDPHDFYQKRWFINFGPLFLDLKVHESNDLQFAATWCFEISDIDVDIYVLISKSRYDKAVEYPCKKSRYIFLGRECKAPSLHLRVSGNLGGAKNWIDDWSILGSHLRFEKISHTQNQNTRQWRPVAPLPDNIWMRIATRRCILTVHICSFLTTTNTQIGNISIQYKNTMKNYLTSYDICLIQAGWRACLHIKLYHFAIPLLNKLAGKNIVHEPRQ